ncbi:MAG TPA: Maf family protein [Granulicella sp.]
MLVLASASPRRRELLTQIDVAFTVETADIDETPRAGEGPESYVQRLAEEKSAAVFARMGNPAGVTVLGADTTVVCEGEILGKPEDSADAARMLRLLSGRTHRVMTGVAMVSSRGTKVGIETTEVEVKPLTEEEIAAYIATGEPMGKAGAYAIQGRAARFIPRVSGCYFNVVGLPLAKVSAMLEKQP